MNTESMTPVSINLLDINIYWTDLTALVYGSSCWNHSNLYSSRFLLLLCERELFKIKIYCTYEIIFEFWPYFSLPFVFAPPHCFSLVGGQLVLRLPSVWGLQLLWTVMSSLLRTIILETEAGGEALRLTSSLQASSKVWAIQGLSEKTWEPHGLLAGFTLIIIFPYSLNQHQEITIYLQSWTCDEQIFVGWQDRGADFFKPTLFQNRIPVQSYAAFTWDYFFPVTRELRISLLELTSTTKFWR